VIWDWFYCYKPWYISWGFSGKRGPIGYRINFEHHLQCFVLIGSDGLEIPISIEQIDLCKQKGWNVYEQEGGLESRLVKAIEPSALPESNGGFYRAFEQWVTLAVKEGIDLLETAHQRIIPSSTAN
jgi:hypothetical protein